MQNFVNMYAITMLRGTSNDMIKVLFTILLELYLILLRNLKLLQAQLSTFYGYLRVSPVSSFSGYTDIESQQKGWVDKQWPV